jgi:putative ABC transport system permease protein
LKPVLGRDFTDSDEALSAPAVTIISYGLWSGRYGKDPSILSRVVRINDVPTSIIGVMPPGLTFPGDAALWVSQVPTVWKGRDKRSFVVFGRLHDTATAQSAATEMIGIGRSLEKSFPRSNDGMVPIVRTFNDHYLGPQNTRIFLALTVAVGFVLLMACVNVANLQLGRSLARTREVAVRVALGAKRWQIMRQLLTESLLLSACGGFLGWIVAIAGVRAFDVAFTFYGKPAWVDFSMDYRVFAYLVAISVGTGALFGVSPAWQLSRVDVNGSLKDNGRGVGVSRRQHYLSGLLVATEIALALILSVCAGVMVRSLLKMSTVSVGVDSGQVVTMRLGFTPAKYGRTPVFVSFYDRLMERLKTVDGFQAIAMTTFVPAAGSHSFDMEFEGAPPVDAKRRPTVSTLVISPEYFAVWNVRLLKGRSFTESDGASGVPVAIVNHAFATKSWPGADPTGKRLRLFNGDVAEPWLTVIGVAPDILQNDILPRQIDPLIYVPFRQKPLGDLLIARTTADPARLVAELRLQVAALDPNLPIFDVSTMERRLARNYWPYRLVGTLFALFAGVGLLLASVGLYTVVANWAGRRTHDIGVRLAIGATRQDILRLVLGEGLRHATIGLIVGLAGAFAITRAIKAWLFGVSPIDPVIMAAAAALLLLIAVAACFFPAFKATRVDPITALRCE